jgi:formylglycine-generating enzyme required for sulfatase activity
MPWLIPGLRSQYLFTALSLLLFSGWSVAQTNVPGAAKPRSNGCPSDMVRVRGFCIDRYEVSTQDRETKRLLSPYYPPLPGYVHRIFDVWQVERFEWGSEMARSLPLPELPPFQQSAQFFPVFVSVAHQVPQAYLSRDLAKRICENSGKRLCSHEEWLTACRGERGTAFPYGNDFVPGRCNVWRSVHPARVLHGNASMGHLDPRLNLLVEYPNDPLLHLTGQSKGCVSPWGSDGVYDMVGNLDEWVGDEPALFVGGFYARNTSKGCESKVTNHGPTYFDYSTGTRCCTEAK